MRSLVSIIAVLSFVAAAQNTDPMPEQEHVINFLANHLQITRVQTQNTIDGSDYLFTTNNTSAEPSWSGIARDALSLDANDGVVSLFILDEQGRILIAVRRTTSGIILMGEAAIAPRQNLPGNGELIPPPVERVEAQPRSTTPPEKTAPNPCDYVRSLECYKPGAVRRAPLQTSPADERNTWGSECTTYQHGNTYGVRCRSW